MNNDPNLMTDGFGAVGDGLTDDSGALNRAISAVAASGGGKVIIPPLKFACANPIYMLPGVKLEGSGSMPDKTPGFAGSQLIATANMGEFITQHDHTRSIHSVGLKGLTIDCQKSQGIDVNVGVYLSPIESRFDDNHITDGGAFGLCVTTVGSANNADAVWTNWIRGNKIEKFDTNLRYEGTDSFITNNYFSFGRTTNVLLDSEGNNMFTANMLDNCGKDPSGDGFTTANRSAVSMIVRQVSEIYKDDGSRNFLATQVSIIGNTFVNNEMDLLFPDSASGHTDCNHVVTGNRFHLFNNNSVQIGAGNRGGLLACNSWNRARQSGIGCVVFTSPDNGSTGWSLGPNSFNLMPDGVYRYINVPQDNLPIIGRTT